MGSQRMRQFGARLMLLCALFSVLLQFAHVMKMNPTHYDEQSQHIQQHLHHIAHQHDGDQETIDDGELVRIKIHVFMHANLGYYMASEGLQLALPELEQPMLSLPPRSASGLIHPPPVPPPLA